MRRRDHRHARRDVLYPAGSLRPGQHVSLMGADGPGKAEIATAELGRARLFCDDWEQASHGGELAAGRRGRHRRARRRDPARRGAGRRRRGPPERRGHHAVRLHGPRDPGPRDRPRGAAQVGRDGPPPARAVDGVSDAEQPGGLEEVEQRIAVAEDRPGDEAAAREAEDVAVAGVAAGDPGARERPGPRRRRGGSRARARRCPPSGSRREARGRRGRSRRSTAPAARGR